jgi:sporulation protein YlmC with PRC-barrel domain
MKPDGPIKLVSELLDLPLFDSDEKYCGIVDDVEFSGRPGTQVKVKALLVGPGAYAGRLPRWAMWLVKKVGGAGLVRVPLDKVRAIDTRVHLNCPGRELGLLKSEMAAAKWVPHRGAL